MGIKQTIVVRKDLNMRKGKIAAQVAHASMMFITTALAMNKETTTIAGRKAFQLQGWFTGDECEWMMLSFRKVVAYVDSGDELGELYNQALKAGILAHQVIDSGLTEFHGVSTLTCIAIGPDQDEKIDAITGHLKLL